jgi:hypothetical protein
MTQQRSKEHERNYRKFKAFPRCVLVLAAYQHNNFQKKDGKALLWQTMEEEDEQKAQVMVN